MKEKLCEIFISIITNEIAPMLSGISITKQAKKIDEQIRERINRENMEIDAEQIDRIFQSKYSYLSDFLNPEVQLPEALERELEEKFYESYRGDTVSKDDIHRYIQDIRTGLYQLLSPENRILERTNELFWSNSIEHQKRVEEKIDLLTTTQSALLEKRKKSSVEGKQISGPFWGKLLSDRGGISFIN